MKVLGVHIGHDSSVCVLHNGEIVHYQEEERVSRRKHASGAVSIFYDAVAKYQPEYIIITYAIGAYQIDPYDCGFLFSESKILDYEHHIWNFKSHHLAHASHAFYNSGFDESAVLVIDGAGEGWNIEGGLWRECETIFSAKYNEFAIKHKTLFQQSEDFDAQPEISFSDIDYPIKKIPYNMSLGGMFNRVGVEIFDKWHQAGKVMGLSAYGHDIPNQEPAFINGMPNEKFLENTKNKSPVDLAYRVQKDSFEPTYELIEKTIELTGHKNICMSGGYFLNCINNFKYLEAFPDINFYIEPNCHDAGTSIGCAKFMWHYLSGDMKKRKLETLYLGTQADYARDLLDGEVEIKVDTLGTF
jgi:carbamoyltransferase